MSEATPWPPPWPAITDTRVREAMARVPRAAFVPGEYHDQITADQPFPIGYGQTISQPYMVALMTQLLQIQPGARILEIGTGSGYQAAMLLELGAQVYSIESIPELAQAASDRLHNLGYNQIHLRQGNGWKGWPEAAPFAGIIVTAAPLHIPRPLMEQLDEGGILVIPIGPVDGDQYLYHIQRWGERFHSRPICPVRFVPMTE